MAAGDAIGVFDGAGREWHARIHRLDRHVVEVDLLDAVTPVAEPSLAVTLAIGYLKGDQMSTVVRDATALGVARIVLLATSHVAVPAAARQGSVVDRLTHIAASSSAQCGRAVVPEIDGVTPLDALLDDARWPGTRVVCVEPALAGAAEGLVPWPGGGDRVTLFVGPEGGWSTDELARFRAAGAFALSLGPRTLRAELAPTVALARLGDVPRG